MKASGGGRFTHSLTSALDGDEWSASRLGRFTPRERAPDTHWIGGWVGSRAGLDVAVKIKIPSPPPPENRTIEPRSSSSYRSTVPTCCSDLFGIATLCDRKEGNEAIQTCWLGTCFWCLSETFCRNSVDDMRYTWGRSSNCLTVACCSLKFPLLMNASHSVSGLMKGKAKVVPVL
jgi:hypothetical protein